MRVSRTLAIAALSLAIPVAPALADALDEAAARGTLRLGVRADAPPFSASVEAGRYEGYSADLCRAVVEAAAAKAGRPIRPDYVTVDAGNRLSLLAEGKIDLLCEATSRTLGRADRVDFSLPTFVTGAGLMIRIGPSPIAAPPLGGGGLGLPAQPPRRIGVLAGTTTEGALRDYIASGALTAQIVEAMTRLAMATSDHRLHERAVDAAEAASRRAAGQRYGQAGIVHAAAIARQPKKLILVGARDSSLVSAANRFPDRTRTDIVHPSEPGGGTVKLPDGTVIDTSAPGAWLCVGQTCLPPVRDDAGLGALLQPRG